MKRQLRISREAGITRFEERRTGARIARMGAIALLGLLLLWLAVPVARVGLLLFSNPFRHAPAVPIGLSVRPVHFLARDGVQLRGWFVPVAPNAPTVILVPGFKADRASMAPYARFLHAARFNVLLYDSRGTGDSSGTFTAGVREVQDVLGAAAYLSKRADVRNHHVGLLGVSLGAGDVIVAGSRLPAVRAIVADSPYTDQKTLVERLDTLHLGPVAVPLAPIAPWLVDRVVGTRFAAFSPLRSVRTLRGRALLLIHSRHDQNPTTPLSAARALQRGAGSNVSLWIAPRGGHAGALAAQPGEYRRRVITFLRRYLR